MTPRSAAVDRAIDLESRVAAPNYQPIPVVLQSGRGEWLFDLDGRRYLDLMSAYSAVSHGHAHPRLVKALTDQAAQVAVTSRAYYSATLGAFLEHLTGLCDLDPGHTRALPSSGGAEAVETAIKAARRWGYRVKGVAPDAAEIVVARGNFHGRSTTIVGFSTEEAYRADFGPFSPGFRHFDFGDIESLKAAINENTCAVLLEPIQGEAGIVVPPDGFLREVRAVCSERRVLLILDEIQSGLGRTGRWFAHQHEGIRPDGLILGKALGGGLLPVSCFVATREIMDLFEPGSHGSTFGGNPLAAAVGLEALRVIEDEGLVARSAALGAHLKMRLAAIASPLVREVRGRGLWVGVELHGSVSARDVVERLAERGGSFRGQLSDQSVDGPGPMAKLGRTAPAPGGPGLESAEGRVREPGGRSRSPASTARATGPRVHRQFGAGVGSDCAVGPLPPFRTENGAGSQPRVLRVASITGVDRLDRRNP